MIGENAASKSKLNFNQSDYEVVDEANENQYHAAKQLEIIF